MFKYEFSAGCPEPGFYWVLSGETLMGILHSDILQDEESYNELQTNPDISFCGPIPPPRSRDLVKIGRAAVKARPDQPIRKI